MKTSKFNINKDLEELSKYGKLHGGGVTRLAFSEEDFAAREYLVLEMEKAGLDVKIDEFGNIVGTREGQEDLPPVMIGSHLDTVPNGGNYDGIIGVVGALEVIRTLNREKVTTKRPIKIINFACEESSRFGVSTLGSKIISGKIKKGDLEGIKDKDGNFLVDVLKSRELKPDEIENAVLNEGEIYSFIEMHIEQGPVLEKKNLEIGLVTAIAAPTRIMVKIEGVADHSGNTPMDMRKDALAGASELVLGVEAIAGSQAGEATVGTIGVLNVTPGAMNVIPGQVELGIDIRDIDMDDKNVAVEKTLDLIKKVAAKRDLKISYDMISNEAPVVLDEKVISALEEETKNLGFKYQRMNSGAGHDAMYMAGITPTGMIFVPSVNGISHNIEEFTEMDDIARGTELLYMATVKLANQED